MSAFFLVVIYLLAVRSSNGFLEMYLLEMRSSNLRRGICRKDGSAISSDPDEDGVDFDLRSAPGFPRLEMSYSQRDLGPRIPQIEASSSRSNLRFDRLQPPDDEFDCEHRRAFGRLVAREAVRDEELWVSSTLDRRTGMPC